MNENDISHTIIAKSDQLNACDLLGGPITVSVQKVDVRKGKEQPVSIHIGEGRQPFKPCKSVLRVLAKLWGIDSSKWTGRSMTLYCDETVTWAGERCGGIRVSHLSHIPGKQEIPIRASQHKVLKVIIHPLKSTPEIKLITIDQRKELASMAEHKGITMEALKATIQDKFGYLSSAEIQVQDLKAIKAMIEAYKEPLGDCSIGPEDIKGEIGG
jgi:hypothetical protein